MRLPPQAPPVRRPELFQPHRTVDVEHSTPEQLNAIRMELMYGANVNDPQYWALPTQNRLKLSGANGARSA